MRAAMDRLERFVTRRRRLVLGVWIVLVVAAVPFAAQQTKHLTAGGFEVPGSGSQAVSEALKRFPGVQTEPLILVFDNSKKDPAALAAAIGKATQEVQGIPNVAVSPAAAAAAKAAGDQAIVLMALDVKGGADSAVDAAVDLRKNLHIQDNGNLALPVHLVGQQALWAGMQDVSKKDLEKAEFAGFPVVFIILLAVFGSLAAALLPFSLGVAAVVLTGAVGLLPLADAADVDLRDQHRVDARHRRGRRLLALHPLALPGGAARRRRSRDAPARPRCGRRAWPCSCPA